MNPGSEEPSTPSQVSQSMQLPTSVSQLLCKNECGFYGNISWEGYCSLCWNKKKKENNDFEVLSFASLNPSSTESSSRPSLSEAPETGSGSPGPDSEPEIEPEVIPRSIHTLVDKKTKEFISKAKKLKISSEALSDQICGFYSGLNQLINQKPEVTCEEGINKCLEIAENHLTKAFYPRFSQNEDDELKDLELQKVIRAFHWVGPAMLGAKLDRTKPEVTKRIDEASISFLQTNSVQLPREKIHYLSLGVSHLLESIQLSTGRPAGADDLLPAIIFLIIITNPPLFLTNLNLIRRLAPPELIRRGEQAYHYCSICSAVEFIESGITAAHLNLTRRQFKQFHIDKQQPPAALMENCFSSNSNKIGGIFEIDKNQNSIDSPALRKIRSIKLENERFFERARNLRREMSEWSLSVTKEVDEILSLYPIDLPPHQPRHPRSSNSNSDPNPNPNSNSNSRDCNTDDK
jgi:hypothetical protein